MESVLTGDLNTRHAPHLQATTSADFFASKEVQAKRCIWCMSHPPGVLRRSSARDR